MQTAGTAGAKPTPLSAILGRVVEGRGGFFSSLIMVACILVLAGLGGEQPLDVLVTGLALGSLYALVALGYTMVYGIIELINFAHGDVFAVGAFASLMLMSWMDNDMVLNGSFNDGRHTVHIMGLSFHVDMLWLVVWTIAVSMVFAAIVCGILGVLIERIAYRRLRNAPKLAPLITAIGVSFIIENALYQWQGGGIINYPTVMSIRNFDVSKVGPVSLNTTLRNTQLVIIVAAVIVMLALDRFVNQTKMGKAMRSVAQDREAALMMGINVDRIIALTFFVGSAVAGAGAVVYGISEGTIGYNIGFGLGLFAFTAAVLGGIGNIRGAMLGGLLIGIIQRFVGGLGSGTEWASSVVFAVLILILVFRPSGLLGARIPEKV